MSEPFTTSVPVRWSDQDSNGHVNNARIATLLEEGRLLWRQSIADIDEAFNPSGLVASLTIDYLRPIVYGMPLDLEVGVTRVGTKSYTTHYVGRQRGIESVIASTVMVATDASGTTRALTDHERDHLERWLLPASTAPRRARTTEG